MAGQIDRSYQDKIVDILGEMKDKQERFSTLIVIPTGGGKTVIGLKYVKEHVISKGDKVLWIAHRKQLLTQTCKSMLEHDFLGFRTLNNFKYQIVNGSADKDIPNENIIKINKISADTDVLFSTVESLAGISELENDNRYMAFKDWIKGINSQNKTLHIIYDEAHHIGGENVRRFFEMVLCPEVGMGTDYKVDKYALIGMTATVHRENETQIAEFYAWFKDGYKEGKLVHNDSKLMSYGEEDGNGKYGFDNRIELIDIEGLIKKGVLVKPDFIRVDDLDDNSEKDVTVQAEYLVNKFKSFSYADWGKTMLFVDNIKLAEAVVKNLPSSIVYTSQDGSGKARSDEELEDARKKFEDKDSGIDIMVTVSLVSEGYDFKDLQTVYLYAPTNSKVCLRQRIGRVLRRSNNGQGDKRAKVIWQCFKEDRKVLSIPESEASDRHLPIRIDECEKEMISNRLDTYVDFTGRKVSNELIDMFVERIIYRSNDEFVWEMNLSGIRSDARKYRINEYSEKFSKQLRSDDTFNIIHSFLVPVDECEKYVTETVKRRFVPKFWRTMTVKIAVK